MQLKRLTIQDKPLFNEFLSLKEHELAVYSFADIYIWKKLFAIRWAVIKDSLCVFFKDKMDCFLYLSPLTQRLRPEVIDTVFKYVSRIENIEANEIDLYQCWGYTGKRKFADYLCLRNDLAQLSGNRFKSKRAAFNYFKKHYAFEYAPFSSHYKDECLGLYDLWAKERQGQNQDKIYQGMLEDSQSCLKTLFSEYKNLDIIGRIVKIEDKIKAFAFGFKLNQDTLCILYEITDLAIKGLSQFIFREFCRELGDYKYINIMDDSGLENLKRVKLSYRPLKLIPAYIATPPFLWDGVSVIKEERGE